MLTWFYFSESQLERIKPFLFFVSMADASSTVSYTSSTRTSVEGGSCWARPAQDPVQSVFQVEQTQCFNNHFTGLANQTLFDGSLMLDSTYLKAHRTAAILLKKGILHVSSVVQKEDWIPNFMPLVTATGGPSCFCWLKGRSGLQRFSRSPVPSSRYLYVSGRRRLWRGLAAGISESQGDGSLHTTQQTRNTAFSFDKALYKCKAPAVSAKLNWSPRHVRGQTLLVWDCPMIRVAFARCILVPMRQRWCESHSAC